MDILRASFQPVAMAKSSDSTLQERQEKRQARRAKQHRENFVRAEKMHEARLSHSQGSEQTSELKHRYYIGCSGWYYQDWRGVFYPEELPKNEWFNYYVSYFGTVELNAPFYSWPTIATVKTWIRQNKQEDFIYTIKVNELITHTKTFEDTREMIRDFGYIADMLGPHMGCFLFQLPPRFQYTPERLKNILSQLEPIRRNVIEFRHSSWWNESVYDAFRKAGTIFCSCSGPRLPDELVQTADEIYIRFHGTQNWYRHDYSLEELKVWAERIKNCDAKHAWIYFNNDYSGHAIRNATLLIKLLKTA